MLFAIDTSTRVMGIALFDGTQVLSEWLWKSQDYHTVELAPAIADVLARTGIQTADLGALAVAIGPGSFTGLRIGLAVAKGLAFAHHIPLIGVPTLDILAAGQPQLGQRMAAVLQAGRGRLAVGWYRVRGKAWVSEGDIEVLTPEDLSARIEQPTYVCGELSAEVQRLLARKRKNVRLASPAQSVRRPAYLAEIGWRRWQANQVDDPATLAPIYLHYNDPIPA